MKCLPMHRSFRKEKKCSLLHQILGAEIRSHGDVSKAVSQDIWRYLNEFSTIQSQILVRELDLSVYSSLLSNIIRASEIEICNQNTVTLIYNEKSDCWWDTMDWPAHSMLARYVESQIVNQDASGSICNEKCSAGGTGHLCSLTRQTSPIPWRVTMRGAKLESDACFPSVDPEQEGRSVMWELERRECLWTMEPSCLDCSWI